MYRDILSTELAAFMELEVVSAVHSVAAAKDILQHTKTDIILLDFETPYRESRDLFEHLKKSCKIPVIVLSSFKNGSEIAAQYLLELGAVDVVQKPDAGTAHQEVKESIVNRILAACTSSLAQAKDKASLQLIRNDGPRNITKKSSDSTVKLIAVGTSTGGTMALEVLFKEWGNDMPPTLAVIHMPERFTTTFANRLNQLCTATISEGVDDEEALTGHIYIAPGGKHMSVRLVNGIYRLRMHITEPINGQRPSVDPLFESVAEHAAPGALGILLTGMGRDGADGLLTMRKEGSPTICQDKESATVFGMPRVAIEIGAAGEILPLQTIGTRARQMCGLPIQYPGN